MTACYNLSHQLHRVSAGDEKIKFRTIGRQHMFSKQILYIPEYNMNGTIIGFIHYFILVQPHDLGPPIRKFAGNLSPGQGITEIMRYRLKDRWVEYNDDVYINECVVPSPGRRGHKVYL